MYGMDTKKMGRMMKQMGIDTKQIKAHKVIIEGDDVMITIENPSVTEINMKGQVSYQISGDIKKHDSVPDDDIKMVMEQTGKDKQTVKAMLKQTDGDIAEAIIKLKEK